MTQEMLLVERDTTGRVLDVLLAVLGDLRAGHPQSPTSSEPDAARAAVLLEALALLRGLREHIAGWEPELITAARAAGASWAQLAPALGVTSRPSMMNNTICESQASPSCTRRILPTAGARLLPRTSPAR